MEYLKFTSDILTSIKNYAEYNWEKVFNLFYNDEKLIVIIGKYSSIV